MWEPTQSKLIENDGEVLLSSRQLAERGFPTADLYVIRKDFAVKYLSVVIQYLKNLEKAKEIESSPPLPVFMRAVIPSYIEEIIPKKKGLGGLRSKAE